jgi:uncharacterized protein YndB with AHSA1/START domain
MEATKTASFETEQDFPVSKEKLYEAWISEESLKQWWKPNGNTLRSLTNDVKEGGEVRYEFVDDDGKHLITISGTYEEAKPAERLVYTWNWDLPFEPVRNANYKLTIEFSGSEDGSHLKVKQDEFANEEAIIPHKEGWEKGLRDLKTYLSGKE